jgi:hypothetical protein
LADITAALAVPVSNSGLGKEFGEQHGSAVKAHHAVLQAMTVYRTIPSMNCPCWLPEFFGTASNFE